MFDGRTGKSTTEPGTEPIVRMVSQAGVGRRDRVNAAIAIGYTIPVEFPRI
jgi:hypothetical protein